MTLRKMLYKIDNIVMVTNIERLQAVKTK